ncbi:Hypothetical protein A7982_02526 [Minicystis rosea]|nr:Hypothetical protein A7982_02526 [Minicystis rosea]
MDLVYLGGELAADDRPAIQALAAPIEAAVVDLRARRASLEAAEDAAVLALARLHKRDHARDVLVVALGGVARATDKEAYGALFPKLGPSETSKLGIEAESLEITRILRTLGALDAEHPLRAAYEQPLAQAQVAIAPVKSGSDAANLELTLARAEIGRFKLALDQLRVATHGQILAIVKDKGEASSFFRPATITAAEDAAPETPSAAAPKSPASIG